MQNYLILASLPILGGLIGWFTNYLAIKMLFHPRRQIRILGIPVQGLLPRRQEEMARQVSETIEEEFFSHKDVLKAMERLEFEKDIEEFIDRIMDRNLPGLLEGIPLLGSFVTDGILAKVKVIFKEEIREYKDQLIGEIAEQIGHAIDVKEMVYEKISDYDMDRLEAIVKRIASKELRHIEILGAVLGFVIGCAQAAMVWFSGMAG